MSDNNYTTKSRKFQHLSKEKRAQIQISLDSPTPKVKIAKMIGIARSTLYRELRRGSTTQLDTNLNCYTRYFYDLGQKVYEQNRANSKNSLKFAKVYDFIKYAEKQMLEKKLSPDAICVFVSKHKLFDKTVCSKTLYNYIDKCLLKVRNIDLALKVKLHTSKRKNRKNKKILGKSIEERSDIINNRIEFGHWEIDTIVGTSSKSSVLLALDERTTRMRIMLKIKSKTAKEVNKNLKKIIEEYKELAPAVFKSITSDNGSEFAKLREVAEYIDIYYAHPYSSFERGTNEKQNSLVR